MSPPQRYDPDRHHRRSIRLKGYDYEQPGAYFVTVCAQNRESLFGDIVDANARLNSWGSIVQACWEDLPRHYPHVQLDAFVVMPNHVHGIVMIMNEANVGAGFKPAPTTGRRHGIPEIVRAFKTFSSRRINESRCTPAVPVWQRNYFEHVIRSETDLHQIREYITTNPAKWAEDEENPARHEASR
jgi:REP element-mobilizing transposase RayT